MPWYWILIILSAIVGPFEAMYALNRARKNREAKAGSRQPETETLKADAENRHSGVREEITGNHGEGS